MNGENRRSREAVRNSVRTYGVKVMDPASLPLKRTKEKESQESVSRYSEKSLHSLYEVREGFCKSLLHRIPYATLLACIVCLVGVVMFSIGRQKSVTVTRAMVQDVLKEDISRLATFDVLFLMSEIITAVIAIMILIIGVLATGDTRARVYSALKARMGGRVCCAVLMGLSIFLFLLWILIFWLFAILVFVVILSKSQCDVHSNDEEKKPLNLPTTRIFTDNKKNETQLNSTTLIKKFCKDYVEKAGAPYITASFASFLVLFSLVLFLICLSANYARIRCQAKFQELQELRHLEGDLRNSKDRF